MERIGELAGTYQNWLGAPDHFPTDHADRRAFTEGAEHAADPDPHGDIHAAPDHGLLRFRAAFGIKDIEGKPVPLEDAAALAELRNASVPGAALRHRDFLPIPKPTSAATTTTIRVARMADPPVSRPPPGPTDSAQQALAELLAPRP
jgi:hypothetical protein